MKRLEALSTIVKGQRIALSTLHDSLDNLAMSKYRLPCDDVMARCTINDAYWRALSRFDTPLMSRELPLFT